MKSDPNNLDEKLDVVILASLDGAISKEQFAWLDRQIIENPEVAQYYVEFMSIYTGLRQPGSDHRQFGLTIGRQILTIKRNFHNFSTVKLPDMPANTENRLEKEIKANNLSEIKTIFILFAA